MKVEKAVIPVAGFGTRFLPVTKVVPKELLPIVDTPQIHYIVEEAYKAGIRQIVFVTASGKYQIEDYFDISPAIEAVLEKKGDCEKLERIREISDMIEIHAVRQKEQKGLGHAIYTARDFVGNDPFAVLLGDDLIDSKVPAIGQMIEVADRLDRAVLALDRVPWDKASRYGIVDPEPIEERVCKIKAMYEKPENPPSNLAIIGRYVLPAEIFDILKTTKPGKGGEIQITDAIATLNGPSAGNVLGYEYEGIRHDGGDVFGFIKANVAYALKRPDLRDKILGMMREYIDAEGK
jgi:UTP--glucose-1-phosphate uridylyltransferase